MWHAFWNYPLAGCLEQATQTFWPYTPSTVNEDKNSIYPRGCCWGHAEWALILPWHGAGFSRHSQVNLQSIMFHKYTSTVGQTISIPSFFFFFLKREFSCVRSLGFQARSLDPCVNNDPCGLCMLMRFATGGGNYYHVGQEIMWGNTLKTLINSTFVPSFSLFSKIQSWVPSKVKNTEVVSYLCTLGTGKKIKVTLQR